MVKVKVQAWGNSLGLRIPKAYAQELRVEPGAMLEVSVEEGALLARPTGDAGLASLLAGVTDSNRHAEVDWGQTSGAEAW